MVTIRCEVITGELISIAHKIANKQQEVVKLIGPTETLEVYYEKEAEESQ